MTDEELLDQLDSLRKTAIKVESAAEDLGALIRDLSSEAGWAIDTIRDLRDRVDEDRQMDRFTQRPTLALARREA